MGSEMCIRDSDPMAFAILVHPPRAGVLENTVPAGRVGASSRAPEVTGAGATFVEACKAAGLH